MVPIVAATTCVRYSEPSWKRANSILEADAPHQVVVTLPQIVADVTGRERRQRNQVELGDPVPGSEAAQQVPDHPGL